MLNTGMILGVLAFLMVCSPLAAAAPVTEKDFDAGEYAYHYWPLFKKGKVEVKWPKRSREEALKSLEIYKTYIRRFAPHWEEEFAQVDRKFGWKPGTCLAAVYYGIRSVELERPLPTHECTSWVVNSALTGNRTVILHKNRDSSADRLALLRRAVPGKNAWIGIGNNSCPFPNMGLNNAGLAVVMNSGSPTEVRNTAGFGTVMLARVLLEECRTAREAVELLRTMVKAGNYLHRKRGSIWLMADSRESYIVEHNERHFAAHPVLHGVGIRANHWLYPEMIPHSNHRTMAKVRNFTREHSVYDILLCRDWELRKKVTLSECFTAARSREKFGPTREICNVDTNSAISMVIDQEFPAELSTAWIACGPPRHTVFIPFPVNTGIEEIPTYMLDGRFSDAIFARRKRTGHDALTTECPSLEKRLRKTHDKALSLARKALRKGDKETAGKILADALKKNLKAVQECRFGDDDK